MTAKSQTQGHRSRTIPLKKNYCFACGQDNPEGMHLNFVLDRERKRPVSRFRLSQRSTGPPGYSHRGIIATILAAAMSKLNKLSDVIAATSQLRMEYIRPIPLVA